MKSFGLLVAGLSLSVIAAETIDNIHIDHFGYATGDTKVAVLSQAQEGFNAPQSYTPGDSLFVRRTSDKGTVFGGEPSQWKSGETHDQSGDKGWWFDFSSVTEEGEYEIFDRDNDVVSVPFVIKEEPWKELLKVATKVFYYQRLGFEKTEALAGANWADGASFPQDSKARSVFDQNNADTERNMSGGWYDAGDYNKYITFAYGPMIHLFDAYEHNPSIWTDDFEIPESGNRLPDLLDELKWEMDWVLRMQDSDGGVFIKIGDKDYGSTTPPSSNNQNRFYGAKSSAATICFASLCARAAAVYRSFPAWESYADTLEAAAKLAWTHFNSNPITEDVDKGEVKAGDADHSEAQQLQTKTAAAIHLWQLTKEEAFHDTVKATVDFIEEWQYYWGQYQSEIKAALLSYTKTTGADQTLADKIKKYAKHTLSNEGNPWTGFSDEDLYRAHMNSNEYNWGSNSLHCMTGLLNYDAIVYGIDEANHDSYRLNAIGHLHYLHGVNPLNKVYLSRMEEWGGENSVREMYHSWFADGSKWDNADTSEYGPAPGYVVGGPNKNYTIEGTFPYGELPQKAYREWNKGYPENSWEITEPAIYYQAHYVRLLSYFVAEAQGTPVITQKAEQFNPSVKLQGSTLELQGGEAKVVIYDLRGRQLRKKELGSGVKRFSLTQFSDLSTGFYTVNVTTGNRVETFGWVHR